MMTDKQFQSPVGGGRLVYNDLAKSLGMLAIMWGHIRLSGWSNAFVYAWHIPLFFFLSGMVFNKNRYADFRAFLAKKIKSLLVPYVIFSVLTWGLWAVFAYLSHSEVDSYWKPLVQTFIAQGSGGFLVHNVPLWFVTCLFVMEIVYYFIADWNKEFIVIATFMLAAVSYCMIRYVKVVDVTLLPWNFEVVCLGIPFYSVGNIVVRQWGHHQMQEWVNRHRCATLLVSMMLAALVVIGSRCNGSISFGHGDIHNPLITYPCAFAGVAMMLLFCMLLAGTKACVKNTWWMRCLKWFGRNSFTAMAIHNPIKGIVCVIVGVMFSCGSMSVSQNDIYSMVAFLVTLAATVVGIVVVNWVKGVYEKLTIK